MSLSISQIKYLTVLFILVAFGLCISSISKLFYSPIHLAGQIQTFVEQRPKHDEALKKHLKVQKDKASKLTKTNFFFPIHPRPPILMTVLGKEAMINDRWYKVGDKVGEEEIISIQVEYIELKKDEKTRQLKISGY